MGCTRKVEESTLDLDNQHCHTHRDVCKEEESTLPTPLLGSRYQHILVVIINT